MYLILGLATALAVSLAGNLLLWNSRDAALTRVGGFEMALKQSNDLSKTCSDSVQALKDQAYAAETIAELERSKVKTIVEVKTIRATRTLQRAPSAPGNECKSTSELLQSWHAQRVPQ